MALEAILFGGIGSVAECAELDRMAWNAAFRAQGLDWDWDWDTFRALMLSRDERSPVLRHARALRQTVDVAAVERAQSRLFAALLAEGLPLRPGVAEVIRAAAGRGLKLGLVSRSATEPVRAMLKATARARGGAGFDVAILRDDLSALPPDPEAYLLALESGLPVIMINEAEITPKDNQQTEYPSESVRVALQVEAYGYHEAPTQ